MASLARRQAREQTGNHSPGGNAPSLQGGIRRNKLLQGNSLDAERNHPAVKATHALLPTGKAGQAGSQPISLAPLRNGNSIKGHIVRDCPIDQIGQVLAQHQNQANGDHADEERQQSGTGARTLLIEMRERHSETDLEPHREEGNDRSKQGQQQQHQPTKGGQVANEQHSNEQGQEHKSPLLQVAAFGHWELADSEEHKAKEEDQQAKSEQRILEEDPGHRLEDDYTPPESAGSAGVEPVSFSRARLHPRGHPAG